MGLFKKDNLESVVKKGNDQPKSLTKGQAGKEARRLTKAYSRREALGVLLGGATAGGLAYMGFKYGLDPKVYGFTDFLEVIDARIAREVGLAYELMSGKVENEMRSQVERFRRQYETSIQDARDLSILTQDEVDLLDQLASNTERYLENRGLRERLVELKDRVDNLVVDTYDGIMEHSPNAFRNAVDGINRTIFGDNYEQDLDFTRDRLDSLVQIYDENRDNRIAQTAVLERINDILGQNLTEDERAVYRTLRDELRESQNNGEFNEDVRDFIINHNDPRYAESITLRNLQAYLRDVNTVFEEYAPTLQGLQQTYEQGIDVQERLQQLSREEANAEQRLRELDAEVDRISETMQSYRQRLEEQGFEIDYDPSIETPWGGLSGIVEGAYNLGKLVVGLLIGGYTTKGVAHRLVGVSPRAAEKALRDEILRNRNVNPTSVNAVSSEERDYKGLVDQLGGYDIVSERIKNAGLYESKEE